MKKPYVVGIAGGSAGGKSTLSRNMVQRLEGYDVKLFEMDAYFKPKDLRPYSKAHVTGKMYVDDNHPETMDLRLLSQNLRDEINHAQRDVIIVEGLLTLQHDEIFELLDLKLFVDCRADERIVRRIKRNLSWGLSFDEISDVYLDMVRYRHDQYVEPSKWRADLILNGSNPSEKALDMIIEEIKRCIKRNAG